MKVYIQSNSELPETDWALSAYLAAKMEGYEIIIVNSFEEVPVNSFYIADIDETIKYFDAKGIYIPPALNIPVKLNREEFLLREIKVCKVKELYHHLKTNKIPTPIFLKPVKIKQFESGVITSHKSIEYLLDKNGLEDVIYCKELKIDSEWRCNIHKGKVQSVNFYMGDPLLFPDARIIEDMIKAYDHAPISYSLDVGVTNHSKKTILIECNDFWSIGNYGLDPKLYLKMLIDRWNEITRKSL